MDVVTVDFMVDQLSIGRSADWSGPGSVLVGVTRSRPVLHWCTVRISQVQEVQRQDKTGSGGAVSG